jgi:hypothetical protein
MQWLLPAATSFGLEIFDRNYGTGKFEYPPELRKFVIGSLPYRDLCAKYKEYRVFLNVNSVSDSPTMFSRRVFELLACGTPIVSTYSKGIEDLFGRDIVSFVASEEEARKAIGDLMNDDALWRQKSLAGIRRVFSSHTYNHRIAQIAGHVGMKDAPDPHPRVAIVRSIETASDIAELQKTLKQQTYSRAVGIGVIRGNPGTLAPAAAVQLVEAHELEAAITSDFKYVSFSDRKKPYEATDLEDLVNATRYAPQAAAWSIAAASSGEFKYGSEFISSASLYPADSVVGSTFDSASTSWRARPIPADRRFCIQSRGR